MGEPSTLGSFLALLSMAFVVASSVYIAWRRRHLSGRTASLVILVASAEWALSSIMAPTGDSISTQVPWTKLRIAGEMLVPAGWLLFSLRCTGRGDWMSRRWLAVPAILPACIVTLGFMFDLDRRLGSPWAELFSPANLDNARTPLGWMFLAYSTALLAGGAYHVFRAPIHTSGLYRRQATVLLWVSALPALGSALDVLGWRPVSYLYLAPAGLVVASLVLAWDLSHVQRQEILPVARDAILASMSDGVLVLDDQKRVVDANPALGQLIGQSPSAMIGRLLSQAWPHCPAVISEASTSAETSMEVILRYEERWRTYDVRVSPLLDWQGRVVSRVVVLRDITVRKRAELTSTAFAALGQQLNTSSSAEDAARIIAEVADELFGWDACFLALCDAEQDTLLPIFQANAPHLPASTGLKPGAWHPPLDVTRQVMLSGGLLLEDSGPSAQASASGNPQIAAGGPTSVMLVPIRLGARPVGILAIQRYAARTYGEDELNTLQALADHCSGALERRRAEEAVRASLREKEVLLKEIHHRVKNNLQVISSLLNLQSHTVQDQQAHELLRESQNRVRSMAMIHERLYRSPDLARVDLAEYTKGLVASLLRSYSAKEGVMSSVDAPAPVLLAIDSAIPCGLIINELVSNSLKYAFPNGKSGQVCVHLSQDDKGQVSTGQVSTGHVSLVVADNGVGLPSDLDFRETESLGLQLVTALVEQLEGTIELDRSNGTAFRISFPGPAIQTDSSHN